MIVSKTKAKDMATHVWMSRRSVTKLCHEFGTQEYQTACFGNVLAQVIVPECRRLQNDKHTGNQNE
jgi:hypothetical protein